MAVSHLVRHQKVVPILRRKGAVGNGIPCVLQSTTSSTLSSSSIVQLGTHHHFLNQCKNINYNRFVPNIIKGKILQLRCHPSLFYNLKLFALQNKPYQWKVLPFYFPYQHIGFCSTIY